MKKKFRLYPINLRLFDGAAAGATGTAAPAGAGEGTAQSGVIQTSSVTGKNKGDLSKVVYGKQAEAVQTGEEGTPQAANEETVTTSDDPEAKKAEFERLIQGEYKDFFEERTQNIINRRFKETKTLEKQINDIKPIVDMLGSKYGISDGDIAKLSKAIQEDDSYYEEEAMEKGLTVEQLKQFKKIERENAEFKKAQADIEARRNAQLTYQKWTQEGDALKLTYPNFDLNTECNNPEFVNMLKVGVGVKAAFNAIHHDEILSGAMQVTAQQVQAATVNNIKSRSQRPSENGMSSQTGVVVKTDVNKLSNDDVMEIARRSKMGERISF